MASRDDIALALAAPQPQPNELRQVTDALLTPAQRPDDYYSSGIYAGQYNPLGSIARYVEGGANMAQDIPVGMIKSGISGLTFPGDVVRGQADPYDVGRALDTVGLPMVGAGLIPAEGSELRSGIKAYHGSPHDFDQFSSSAIGTGEGAQAYGHGLYFAGNENIAKSYRDALSREAPKLNIPDELQGPSRDLLSLVHENMNNTYGKLTSEQMKQTALDNLDGYSTLGFPDEIVKPAKDALTSGTASYSPSGHMYEVNINADPEHFLDWDKPLSGQSPQVRDAINRVGRDVQPYGLDRITDDMRPVEMKNLLNSSEGTSALQQAGVPGIKYLDAGSRTVLPDQMLTAKAADLDRQIANAHSEMQKLPSNYQADYQSHIDQLTNERQSVQRKLEPSRNYVVFDDNLVNIVRKYGIAGALSAGLITAEQAAQMQGNQDFQQAYASGGAT